ncbi:D-alanyl-D-alanine carboxypeptidase/D-alanyl-D-alanine endopeptidase [Kutzneria chonburiensis]|uniref:D-alanyl-D-alanine carboxypeptidase/D-alanyl-D-alanine-endopeptidase n=1 Tax=Kutzneria chonburiensis TaxID=1483604 RepID=A0ABV6N2N8_9PSEU|nr:D-alanyl-D-alanine carboxypeptidase/D-alanyl-D-alanine-endopeptidase [Kutzneria chonburiensis]
MPESGQPAPAWPTQPVEDASEPAVAAGEGAQVGWPSADGDGSSPAWPSDESRSPDGVKVAAEESATAEVEPDIEDETDSETESVEPVESEAEVAVEEQDTEPATQQVQEPVKQSEPAGEAESPEESEPAKQSERTEKSESVEDPVTKQVPVAEQVPAKEQVAQQLPVPVKQPAEEPAARQDSVPEPVAEQVPAEQQAQQPPVPVKQPAKDPVTQQVPVPQPVREADKEPVAQAAPESVEEPPTQPVPEPVTQQMLERPTKSGSVQPVPGSPTQQVSERSIEPVAEPLTQQVSERPIKPVAEPLTQQVSEPPTRQVSERPPKPGPERAARPVPEPPTQPVPEPPTSHVSESPAQQMSERPTRHALERPTPPDPEPPTQQVERLTRQAPEPPTQQGPERSPKPGPDRPVPEPATQRVQVPPPPVPPRTQPPAPFTPPAPPRTQPSVPLTSPTPPPKPPVRPAPPREPVTQRVPVPPPPPKIQPPQPVPPPKPVSKEPETLRIRLADVPTKAQPMRIEPARSEPPVSPLEDTIAMPVDNDRARLDPPTVQLPGPGGPSVDDTPTIRVQVPRPPAAGRPELGDDVPQPAPQLPPPPRTSPENDVDEPAPRRSRKPLLVGLAIFLVLAVGATVYFGSSGFGGSTVVATAPPPSPAAPNLLIKPLGDAQGPTAAGVAAKIAGPVSSPALGTLTGSVIDPATGTTLWERNSSTPLTPASAGKVLTMTAALLSLDPQFRFTTTVVAGPDPDTVVLVGGGDPTLSSLPAGKETVYPGAARLDDLVAQVKQATGGTVHKVLLDTNRYSGDAMAPGWENSDIAGGSVAPITPIMLDGGRSRPTVSEPARTATPDTDAAKEFARRLGADPNSVAKGTAGPDAKVLGTVQSPPLTDMVSNLLQISDNVLAEAIGREVAKQAGAPVTFAGGSSTVLNILRNNNFDLTGVTMVDGSGLSTQDRVTAKLLGSIMTVAAGPDGGSDPRVAKLRPLLNGLPVAGGSGTLADRYGDASSAPGKGWVRAKTGTLDGVNTLTGIVQTADGKVLAFALMSNGSQIDQGRAALDNVAAALRGCGCR